MAVRAVEKIEEEWSPSSLDALTFHVNQLYRLLVAYCDDQQLEEVGRSLALLTELEQSVEEAGHTGFAANLIPGQNRRGRPKFGISEEQLQHLQLHFPCPKTADLLGVYYCLSTVRRRMKEYGLSVSALYSEISDMELDRLINEVHGSFPNCGYRMMDGHLRQRGISVTQARI